MTFEQWPDGCVRLNPLRESGKVISIKRSMPEPLIIVTGAAGGVGSIVHRTLLEAGKNTRATDWARPVSTSQPLIWANLEKPRDCRRILQDVKVLVHLAYERHPDEFAKGYTHQTFDRHIRMNRQVFLEACKAGVKKIIFSSSVQVVARQRPNVSANQPPRSLPLNENSLPEPDNWYSLTKYCSEEMLAMLRREYEIDYVVLRFPMLIHSVPIPHPEHLQSRLSEAFSYLTMRDAADLILRVIDADLRGARTYLPASQKNTQGLPIQEILRKYYAGVALQKPVDEMESLVDLSSLTRDTGWEPRDLSQQEVETALPSPQGLRARILRWLPTSSVPLT
jgi:nucleoside-diphosphate-sugar epimerase